MLGCCSDEDESVQIEKICQYCHAWSEKTCVEAVGVETLETIGMDEKGMDWNKGCQMERGWIRTRVTDGMEQDMMVCD